MNVLQDFVGVFCGASGKEENDLFKPAYSLGVELAHKKLNILYGGGTNGCSKALLDGVISVDKTLMTAVVLENEVENIKNIGIKIHKVKNIEKRKIFILTHCKKIFIMAGGLGTLDELASSLALKQAGIYNGEIIIFDPSNFWGFLDQGIKLMLENKLISKQDSQLYQRLTSLEFI